VVTETEVSTPLLPLAASEHDPEPVRPTSHPHNISKIHLTNIVVTETEVSTPLLPLAASEHDPEPVRPTSHPHNISL